MKHLSPSIIRAALWAVRARSKAQRVVCGRGIGSPVDLPPAPPGTADASAAVTAVLARTRATCLVRSLVLQRWLADHGENVDVIIGVTPPSAGFRAHAWLDGHNASEADGFTEIHRLPAPPPAPAGWGRRGRGALARIGS